MKKEGHVCQRIGGALDFAPRLGGGFAVLDTLLRASTPLTFPIFAVSTSLLASVCFFLST